MTKPAGMARTRSTACQSSRRTQDRLDLCGRGLYVSARFQVVAAANSNRIA
jgi:hypothetical protein